MNTPHCDCCAGITREKKHPVVRRGTDGKFRALDESDDERERREEREQLDRWFYHENLWEEE